MKALFLVVLPAALATACGGDDSDPGDGTAPVGAADAGTVDEDSGASAPLPTFLPQPGPPCPTLVDGTVEFAYGDEGKTRDVDLHMGPEAAEQEGPLIFYWHGTGSVPAEVQVGLGAAAITEIKAAGGIIASFHRGEGSSGGVFPWNYTAPGSRPLDDDMLLADQVLACAIEQVGIDVRRIHTTGISAGALHSVRLAQLRSGYMASLAPLSGGLNGVVESQNPDNRYAAMVVVGGDGRDVAFNVEFHPISRDYFEHLTETGHFALWCDHGGGHAGQPAETGLSVWRFFQDHPYGAEPSPYENGLPEGFVDYCRLDLP